MAMASTGTFWPFDVSDNVKARAFDSLLSHYFDSNFGTIAKSEFELMLFSFYYDQCKLAERREGVDYTSDYVLSRRLGITQTRVRSLKLRKSLKEPEADEMWVELFAHSVEKAQYDEKSGLVKMTVPDVTVLVELRHRVETLGWYDEYQLNPKLFQCPPLCLIEVCNSLCKPTEILLDEEAIERLRGEKMRIEKETGNDRDSKTRKSVLKIIDAMISGANVADRLKDYIPSAELKMVLGLLGKTGFIAQALFTFGQKL